MPDDLNMVLPWTISDMAFSDYKGDENYYEDQQARTTMIALVSWASPLRHAVVTTTLNAAVSA